MTVETMKPVEQIIPIARSTDARELAETAYDHLLALLEQLEPDEWATPTECGHWDVAAMVGHLIGAGKSYASMRELIRQFRWAGRHAGEFDGNQLDAVNELQVRDHADLAPAQRLAALRAVAPRAVAGRMRMPRPLRWARIPMDAGGSTAPGMPAKIVLGHLMDVILTRDVWMHRVDIARATGRQLDLDPAFDGRIVEDVVAEWAGRHGQPFVLTLTGPAGGRFGQGPADAAAHMELDAVELCRILSGRAEGTGLLGTRVVF
jgi:uncharacterized protein (TIGR03083 family)